MSWVERGEGDSLNIKCMKRSERKYIAIRYPFTSTCLVSDKLSESCNIDKEKEEVKLKNQSGFSKLPK